MFYMVENTIEHAEHDDYAHIVVFNPETYEIKEEHTWVPLGLQKFDCSNYPVASSEIVNKYKKFITLQEKLQKRKDMIELKNYLFLDSYHEAGRLQNSFENYYNDSEAYIIKKLLRTKKFRSHFRESLAKQIRSWCRDKNPKYKTPLSYNQICWL